ncbi:MAG: cytochrome c biogenesis protein CcdA, partial [Chitinophagia bacterium]|nr:cytochrome c biogenesis protein CcdA [Chitinophagia bacterium]
TKVKLQGASGIGKKIFGMLLIVVSLTILIGQDKKAEEILNQYSPDWLTALTTTY